MKTIYLLVFLKCITSSEAVKPKSVNVELETIFEFNRKNIPADLKMLDSIQNFIGKVKTVVSSSKPSRKFNFYTSESITFTNFIRTLIVILKSYKDEDLEDIFAVFNDEIRKYHYKGCKFYELLEDHDLRRYVAQTLNVLKEENGVKLRKTLDALLQLIDNSKFSTRQTEFFDYMDSLYRQKSSDMLKNCLDNLQAYRRKSKRAYLNIIELVRDSIRSIIFDHYTGLNPNARRDFKMKIETIWRDLIHPEISGHKMLTVGYTNIDSNDISMDDTTKPINKAESSFEISEEIITFRNKHKTTKNKLRQAPKNISEEFSKALKSKLGLIKKRERKHNMEISTFITLYPDKIDFNTKDYKIEPTTRQTIQTAGMKIEHKTRKPKNYNKRKLKTTPHRLLKPDPLVVSEVSSGVSDESLQHERRISQPKMKSKSKPIAKYHRRYSTKSTHAKYRKTTSIKHRKLPQATHPFSDEGIPIENNFNYNIERRALGNKGAHNASNSTQTQRRINSAETKTENVEYIINEKETDTSDKETSDTNISITPVPNFIPPITDFEPLEFTSAKNNLSTSTASTTTKNYTTTSSTSQYDLNKDTSSNESQPETTESDTITQFTKIKMVINNTNVDVDTSNETETTTISNTNTTFEQETTVESLEQMENNTIDQQPVENSSDHKVDDSPHDSINKMLKRFNVTIDSDLMTQQNTLNITYDPATKAKLDNIRIMIEKDLKRALEVLSTTEDPLPDNLLANPFNEIDSALGLSLK